MAASTTDGIARTKLSAIRRYLKRLEKEAQLAVSNDTEMVFAGNDVSPHQAWPVIADIREYIEQIIDE